MPKEEEKEEIKDPKKSKDRKFQKRGSKKKFNKEKSFKKEIRTNPVEWYNKYAVLAGESAKLGFNHIKGRSYLGALEGASFAATQVLDLSDTNVARVSYIPTPGIVSDTTSGFTMQIRRLYLAMKRKYRGLNTYQIADLGITLFCISEFYRLIAKLERIYGVFNYFNPKNRIMPQYLPTALRVDANNIYNHLADFRAGINALIIKSQSLCLPKGMDIINRWMFLESNLFKDSEDDRAMYILFDDMNKFYTYQPTWSSTGGSAVLSRITASASFPNSMTYNELLDAANDVLDILLNDDDITLQLGDIVSYFTQANGDTDLLVLQTIPEDYVVVPSHNSDVLEQIHNSASVGDRFASDYNAIYSQVTPANFDVGARGSLIFNETSSGMGDYLFLFQNNALPVFNMMVNYNYETANHKWVLDNTVSLASSRMQAKPGNTVLDTWKEVPSSDDILEMTRLTPHISTKKTVDGGSTYNEFDVVSCGSEVITVIEYYFIGGTIAVPTLLVVTGAGAMFALAARVAKLDWHPHYYLLLTFDTTATGGNYTIDNNVFGDFDNARVLHVNDLDMIHDAALMSLFEVSSVEGFKNPK